MSIFAKNCCFLFLLDVEMVCHNSCTIIVMYMMSLSGRKPAWDSPAFLDKESSQ